MKKILALICFFTAVGGYCIDTKLNYESSTAPKTYALIVGTSTPVLASNQSQGTGIEYYSITVENWSTSNYLAYTFSTSNSIAPTISCTDKTSATIPVASGANQHSYLTEQFLQGKSYMWLLACGGENTVTVIVRGK